MPFLKRADMSYQINIAKRFAKCRLLKTKQKRGKRRQANLNIITHGSILTANFATKNGAFCHSLLKGLTNETIYIYIYNVLN